MASNPGRAHIGVRELRNEVAAVLRRAREGERIVITVDGSPTAQIGPLEPPGRPGLDDLIATGQVVPSRRERAGAPTPMPRPVDVRLDQLLDELRGA
ncbi:MAG: type II toxin-antitoxin system prevent-host-death family antitoxin [Acidimicrobiia bacterium]|nr:type II toxin-antitoxin system prevent-host-death family antitoxin [Acidimicrobiia bacterium]MDH5237372.1 type II toxin-antitoxin system prevent-host-death family antitoxin [Acidimicrobiia bacterium]